MLFSKNYILIIMFFLTVFPFFYLIRQNNLIIKNQLFSFLFRKLKFYRDLAGLEDAKPSLLSSTRSISFAFYSQRKYFLRLSLVLFFKCMFLSWLKYLSFCLCFHDSQFPHYHIWYQNRFKVMYLSKLIDQYIIISKFF